MQGVSVIRGDPVLVFQQQPVRVDKLPMVMYTMGLATATMSEYSSIAKRSSGSSTWQARQMNLLNLRCVSSR